MRFKKLFLLSFLSLFVFLFSTSEASAKVMWGKTELKKGQIGKVTILTNVNATKIKGNTLTQDKRLKKSDEYRIYSYRVVGDSGYYGLGGGLFVKKSKSVKYETPSKAKLAQLEKSNGLEDRSSDSIRQEIEQINFQLYALDAERGEYPNWHPRWGELSKQSLELLKRKQLLLIELSNRLEAYIENN